MDIIVCKIINIIIMDSKITLNFIRVLESNKLQTIIIKHNSDQNSNTKLEFN